MKNSNLFVSIVTMFAVTACTASKFDSDAAGGGNTTLASAAPGSPVASGDGSPGTAGSADVPVDQPEPPPCLKPNIINGESFIPSFPNGAAAFLQEEHKYGAGASGCNNVANGISGGRYPTHYVAINGFDNTVLNVSAPTITGYAGTWLSVNGTGNTVANVSNAAYAIVVNGANNDVDLSGASTILSQMNALAITHDGDTQNAVDSFANFIVNGDGNKICVSGLEQVLQHKVAEGVYIYGQVELVSSRITIPGGTAPVMYLSVTGFNANLCD